MAVVKRVYDNVEIWIPLRTASGNVQWQSDCGKMYQFLKSMIVELPLDPDIPLLGVCSKELKADSKSVPNSIIHNS